ncbi:prepilin peptidase [Legionella hackeliae]|uniref:Prepilin leader peptidase/N-methyltransferase n=1 Tax=Legionella hackeliae TaxID=449 RepID=A0A0A8UUC6_LEGHA|nr:A24 family peptidase [Legionella hackeliae]KTD11500.1 type 4 (IV) prepilin-like protein leader peptide processing enzyme PilD [Legionella hackeliae]CEK10667.1 Type 4 prepilin-like proteins leader peptide-processing enzyme [Includes: Leader peptidase; N-methyltransferase] [Legionella hackeliae]STX47413.1 type 4 (IV) prepilin-like protein leader peptide processing enzyme PilD [Legionella hackeliae]
MFNQIEIVSSPTTYIFLALFTLAIGSLLNVIIYRLPIMLRTEFEKECRAFLKLPELATHTFNLFLPRSFCPQCKTTISAFNNIPIVSYCLQRGRCRQCGHAIPIRYPIVEGVTCLIALLSAWTFGFNLTLLFVLLFSWLLICLFFIDLEHQILPDSLTLSLLWLGLIANTRTLFASLTDAVLSSVIAYLSLWLLMKIFYWIRGKVGMGNGDFKLFAALAAWFGWTQLPLILFVASILGAITGLTYLKLTKQGKDTPIPFGPFLCISGFISLFWGKAILHGYIGLFL